MNSDQPAGPPNPDHQPVSGKALRREVPRKSHGEWEPQPGRDPIGILLAQEMARVPELLPIRHGRMAASPFAFYRGGAAIMAADLAPTPATGIRVQACGDAHISNFGGYAAPDRRLIFDLNDFDETLPAAWEWDVKRMAASAVIAARENGADRQTARQIARTGARRYREVMRELADRSFWEVWHTRLDVKRMIKRLERARGKEAAIDLRRDTVKAGRKDSDRALRKLTETRGDDPRFASRPPLLVPVEELAGEEVLPGLWHRLENLLAIYRETLPDDRRFLLDHYRFVHMARKVVGVGSVGTRAWVLLLVSGRRRDPLVLQVKQAQESVLAPYAGASAYLRQGQRVVEGQRLTQAASDSLLGWLWAEGPEGVERDFYVRQLWDGKLSFNTDAMDEGNLTAYVWACGGALALAHARSGDRVAIAEYLGRSDTFDRAIAEFSDRYAARNRLDYEEFLARIDSGEIEATTGV
ncbi:MAG: DUF2252 domain-containing protein [Solirubrobacterales bacterium]|nr:DUF2252 domain-containing protein [Solirubrobacterales bacterium]